MNDTIIMLTTFPDEASASAFASQLVNHGLAACVNILPSMTSIYCWEGELEQGSEHQLVIKTTLTRRHDVEQALKNSHPYSLPELLVIESVSGSDEYLNWIHECTHAD